MISNFNEILSLIKNNKFKEAEKKCKKIENSLTKNAEFLHTYGFIFFNLKNYDQAIEKWKKALNIDPKFVYALNNLGNVLSKVNKPDEAIQYLNKALEIKPDFFETFYTLSEIYFKKNDFENSLININKAIKLKPDNLLVAKIKIEILLKLNKKKDLLNFLDDAISYHPKNAELYNHKAKILSALGMKSQSMNSYKTVYMLDQNFPYVLGNIVNDKLTNCEWDGIEKEFEEIKNKINQEQEVADPFLISTLFDSSHLQNKAAKIWIKQHESNDEFNKIEILNNSGKINLGYYSTDFRDHPIGHLISKMLETHDKSKFDIYGFYLSKKQKENDRYYLRIKKIFKEFYDVSDMSEKEIILLSRDLKIDIAVDLVTHTGDHDSKFGIFQNRCAPLQINFLGYPGTSGSDKIDYIIADRTVIPEKNKKFFAEKIIYLPGSYQPSEKDRLISEKIFTKKDLNLPENNFIYCCFNTNKKILPLIFKLWSQILKKVPDSVLWLISDNELFKTNFRHEFQKKGIDPNRIIFSTKIPIEEHLKRSQIADLFLDTFPYNAHTTCSDSIWAGVPLLTIEGQSFQSRVASSLLKNSGLDELVAKNQDEYLEKAIFFAKNKNHLEILKKKMIEFMDKNPIFDNIFFTKNIENAYSLALEKKIKREQSQDIYL